MFAFAVELLTGRYVATAFDDRGAPEWPPHPARLFAALAAALAETGGDQEERAALEWLERQGPPALAVGEAEPRDTSVSYVPVNDTADPGGYPVMGEGFPLGRGRQPRSFPSVAVRPATVHFIWERAVAPAMTARSLAHLASKVSYLGHSSSVVAVRFTDAALEPTLVPATAGRGQWILRVPVPGQLAALEEAHRVYIHTGIRGALPCGFQAYGEVGIAEDGPVEHRTVSGDMVVFRRYEGPRLPITAAEAVAAALRGALMESSDEPIPEVLSGHASGGGRSERPHAAFVPLPDVGHPHADGHLMGVAVVLPRELSPAERSAMLKSIGAAERRNGQDGRLTLTLGKAGAWGLERVSSAAPVSRALRPETWIEPSTMWASVTPIELDIYPREPYGSEARSSVERSCERIGLQPPVTVLVTPQSVVLGSEPWHAFARRADGSKRGRPLVHVVLSFAEPVRGPVLLGAGRYRGLGLCRPFPGGRASRQAGM